MRQHILVVTISSICGIALGLVLFYVIQQRNSQLPYPEFTATNTQSPDTVTPPVTPKKEQDFCIDVPILTYHHIQPFEEADPKNQRELTVTPANFEWHMRTLHEKGYSFLSVDELIDALKSKKPLGTSKPIIITLDDGYADAYTYAFPIAQKYGVHLNIGIITGLTGNPEHLYVSQMKKMLASGHVSLYNHSWSHMNLKSASHAAIDAQVAHAQTDLFEWLELTSTAIIYPYGVSGEYVRSILPKNNIRAGLELSLTEKSTIQCASGIFQLPRLRVGNAGPGVYGL